MKKIVLTGGGTAGHVTPNIALLPALQAAGYEIAYVGSYEGIEKKLIADFNIPYTGISTGKFRRYLDPKNFSDPFRVMKGFVEARNYLKNYQPDVVFSKGGFVSVPVVRAAASLHIPCIIHESDMTPGLANKLCIPVAEKVCCNFPETLAHVPEEKAVLTGTPIRAELLSGDADRAFALCNFTDSAKPTLLVVGGSSGSRAINTAIRDLLPELIKNYNVIHLCGKGNVDTSLNAIAGYAQFEYANEELADLFALSSLVISRAGANAICELLALRKPNILIPLPAAASRGDQILNAASFEKSGYSVVIQEKDVTNELLLKTVNDVYTNREQYIHAMDKSQLNNSIEKIVGLINEARKHNRRLNRKQK